MKFLADIEVEEGLKDSDGDLGTAGQVLSSTSTGTNWIDQSTIVAGSTTVVEIECKNTSGSTITKGTPVYQTGTVGATAAIEVAPADALISANKLPAIGLLQTDLINNAFGFVVVTGELLNITTSPIDGVTPTTGDKIFVKSGGGLTLTKPTGEGNGIQNMGLVGKVSGGNSGSITVSSIMRTNDVPNLPEGRIWAGDGNTIVSDTVYIDEPNLRLGIGTTSPTEKLHVDGNVRVTGAYYDSNNSAGSNGQVLSSANSGTTTEWVNASSGTIGGSIADNQIAVGASTANNIEGSDDFRLIPYTIGSVTLGRLVVQGRLEISDQMGFGAANLFIGPGAGSTAWSGANLGIGGGALGSSAGGELNCAVGYEALSNSTLGDRNTALGQSSLFFMTGTGQDDNIAIGAGAAQYYSTGTGQLTQSSQGVYIGSATRASANNISNEIVIGYSAVGGGSDTITLGNSSIDTFRIPGLGNTNGHVLTYSTADDGFILAAGGGGGGIGGATVTNQVAFGAASSTTDITSDSTFTFAKNGLTGSQATTLFEVGDGDSSDNTSYGSVFITAKQVNDSTSRARFQLYSENNLRGYLQCSGTSTDVTLLSNANLVLEGAGKVIIDGGPTNDVVIASASGSGVGIGTTSPSKKLTVNGTIYSEQASGEVMIAGDSSYASKYITIREGANYAARWGLQAVDDIVTSGVALMSSAKPIAFRASNNIAFDSISLSHLIIRPATTNGSANVGIGTDDPQSKLQVAGGIQMADDTDDASADKVGTIRYREVNTAGVPGTRFSYTDMCMRTDTSTYEWVNIVANKW